MSDPLASPPATPISLSEIVTILLRILAINFGFYDLSALFGVLARGPSYASARFSGSLFLIEYGAIGFLFLCAYWLWRLARMALR